jgi:hypothetical protein
VQSDGPAASLATSSTATYGGYNDKAKGKNTGAKGKGKKSNCFTCGGFGHFSSECSMNAGGNWGQPVQSMPQYQPQPAAHQPQVVPPMMAIANGNPGGKGKQLAAQISNVFAGKGGKGGKKSGGNPKGY